MKKKLLGFLLGAMLIFVCAGCGAESTSSETVETVEATSTEESTSAQTVEDITTPVETESPTPEKAEEPSEESTPEPTAEPIPEPTGLLTILSTAEDIGPKIALEIIDGNQIKGRLTILGI